MIWKVEWKVDGGWRNRNKKEVRLFKDFSTAYTFWKKQQSEHEDAEMKICNYKEVQ